MPTAPAALDPCGWHVLVAKPRKERVAEINLHRQGFQTFRPGISIAARRQGKAAQILEPLFPGYLFVRFDRNRDRWQAINSTLGVQRLVSVKGSQPTEVPTGVMQEIIQRCPDGVWQFDPAALRCGDEVRMVGGPFSGMSGRFEEMVSHDRVKVLMSLLQSEVSVVVPASFLGVAA